MEFGGNLAASHASSSVSSGHQVFVPLHLPPFTPLYNSKTSATASDNRERSETPPPILDCYASTEPIDGRMVIEEYMRVNANDDEPVVLTNEAEQAQQHYVLGCVALNSSEATTSEEIKKPLRVEKKVTIFSENPGVRRSARQIKRKWASSKSPEGSPSKNGRVRTSPRSSAKAQIYETGPIRGVIRVGDNYQAEVLDWNSPREEQLLKEYDTEREDCLWKYDGPLNTLELEEFYQAARRQFGMDPSNVLETLQHHNFEIISALEHVEEHIPERKKPFSSDEHRLFFKGLATHGKDFRLIHNEFIPSRSVRELVEYYYDTKNTKCFGCMKKCCPKLLRLDAPEDLVLERSQCDNCNGAFRDGNRTESIHLCGLCNLYFRKTGQMRPINRSHEKPLENREIHSVKDEIFRKGQCSKSSHSSSLTTELTNQNHSCSYTAPRLNRLQKETRWTPYEIEAAVRAFFLHGKDFQAVSASIGSKSAATVKRFYIEKQSMYRLDFLINRR